MGVPRVATPTLFPKLPRTEINSSEINSSEINSSDAWQCTRSEGTLVRVNSGYCSLGCHETFATPNPAPVVRSVLVSPSTIICTVILL